jgi:activating signal cointegrator 1
VSAPFLPALTLWQPYASLVACGAKTIETRGQRTNYRGRIAIHASSVPQAMEPATVALPAIHDALWPHLGFTTRPMPADVRQRLPRGAIVATAELVGCVPIVADPAARNCVDARRGGAALRLDDPDDGEVCTDITAQVPFGDYTPGRWAWLLADRQPTTERCPWCWGDGGFQEDSMILYGVPGGSDWSDPCPVCNPRGRRTEPLGVGAYGCAPVPARGMPGMWRWRP